MLGRWADESFTCPSLAAVQRLVAVLSLLPSSRTAGQPGDVVGALTGLRGSSRKNSPGKVLCLSSLFQRGCCCTTLSWPDPKGCSTLENIPPPSRLVEKNLNQILVEPEKNLSVTSTGLGRL